MLPIEMAAGAITSAGTGVSHCSTYRMGAFRRSTFAGMSCGSLYLQQFAGSPDETQSSRLPPQEAICLSGDVMAPATQVATVDVMTPTMTNSATIPAARIRITHIIDL